MAGDLVLITGATGHVGFHVLILALDAGYRVRAAVRSEAKAQSLLNVPSLKSRQPGTQLAFTIVPDLTVPGAYDEAVKGVQYIIHIASPISSSTLTPDQFQSQLIEPAVKGTLGILESAQKTKGVRRIVITSSIAATIPFENIAGGSDKIFKADDRIPTPDTSGFKFVFQAYSASKVKALNETEAWVKRERPEFDLVHVHPSFIMGRDELQTSRENLKANGTNQYIIRAAIGEVSTGPVINATVHVNDVARVHVGALSAAIPGNTSYIVNYNPEGTLNGSDYGEIPTVVAKYFPDALAEGTLSKTGKQPYNLIKIDATKTEKAFGFTHLSFEEQVKDVVGQYLDAEA